MEIIKLPWNFMNTQMHGELGMTLECMEAAETNTWQTGRRRLEMVTVMK